MRSAARVETDMGADDLVRKAVEYTPGATRNIIHRLVAAGEFERVYRKRGSGLPNLYRHLDLR